MRACKCLLLWNSDTHDFIQAFSFILHVLARPHSVVPKNWLAFLTFIGIGSWGCTRGMCPPHYHKLLYINCSLFVLETVPPQSKCFSFAYAFTHHTSFIRRCGVGKEKQRLVYTIDHHRSLWQSCLYIMSIQTSSRIYLPVYIAWARVHECLPRWVHITLLTSCIFEHIHLALSPQKWTVSDHSRTTAELWSL